MDIYSRRGFFKTGAKTALAGTAAGLMAGCPQPAIPPDTPYDQSARVAAVLGNDLSKMARNALEEFGGAASFVEQGDDVFIKPNFGAVGMVKYDTFANGDSAKPEIVIAVAEECLLAGASRVTIGDAGQAKTWAWEKVHYLDGSANIVQEVERLNRQYGDKVSLACLNADSPTWDPVPSPYTKLGSVYVSSLITRADKVISVAVAKSHRWCSVTGSMKNFVGSTSTDRYGMGIQWRFMLHDAGIDQCFLDIVKAVKPVFAIVDCSICVEGNGPHVLPGCWGDSVNMQDRLGSWLLLASNDLAALDATEARVMSHDVAKIKHLNMAWNQNIGQIQEDRIEIAGPALDQLRVPWKPAQLTEGFAEVLIPGIMLLLS